MMMIVFYAATTLTVFLILGLLGAPIILGHPWQRDGSWELFRAHVRTREKSG